MYNNNAKGKVWRQSTDPANFASNNDVWLQIDGGGNPLTTYYRVDNAWRSGPSATLPPGFISLHGASTPPSGYLECNGAAISRATYSALFAVIGTAFGAGDGTTTFNLPDMRGMFARGWAGAGSVDAGRVFGSVQQDALESHTHNYRVDSGITGSVTANRGILADSTGTSGERYTSSATGDTETRPVNVALLYVIKT